MENAVVMVLAGAAITVLATIVSAAGRVGRDLYSFGAGNVAQHAAAEIEMIQRLRAMPNWRELSRQRRPLF
jgi:hypothetical protein